MAELLAQWLEKFLSWGEEEWDNVAYAFIIGLFGLTALACGLRLVIEIFPTDSSGWVEAIGVNVTVLVTARLYFADVKRRRREENAEQVSLIETAMTILHTAMEGVRVMRFELERDRAGRTCPHNGVLLEPLAQIRQLPFAAFKDGMVRQSILLAQGTLANLAGQFALDGMSWTNRSQADKVTIVTVLLDALIKLQPTLEANMRDLGTALYARSQLLTS